MGLSRGFSWERQTRDTLSAISSKVSVPSREETRNAYPALRLNQVSMLVLSSKAVYSWPGSPLTEIAETLWRSLSRWKLLPFSIFR